MAWTKLWRGARDIRNHPERHRHEHSAEYAECCRVIGENGLPNIHLHLVELHRLIPTGDAPRTSSGFATGSGLG